MPYKSDAQRRFMHARHPDIAAKWDSEIRAKKKGKVEKSSSIGPLIPSARLRLLPDKKKGKVKKVAYEDVVKSADPEFNHRAARKIFDAIMKMDDDTAEMFSFFLVNDVVEETIEKNLPVLQKHLDEVISKRMDRMLRATAHAVVKSRSREGLEFAMVLAEVSKATKRDYKRVEWDEQLHPRGHGGQFRVSTRVSANQQKPIGDRTAETLGLPTRKQVNQQYKGANKLDDADLARYQDQYRQLSNFLQSVRASTSDAGGMDTVAHLEDRTTGERSTVRVSSTRASDVKWNPKQETLIGLDARPNQLTAGGAYFGLATALGAGGMENRDTAMARGVNAFDTNMPRFAEDWNDTDPDDLRSANNRTYRRISTGSQFVESMAPPGSKVALAARTAQFVGDHGPEAEKVIGPTARKTAYRYRGTSKNPDRDLLFSYDRAVRSAKYDALPENIPTGQMAVRRRAADMRQPTDAEINEGRRAVYEHLEGKLPAQDLYGLQLASGNTPPSEGVLINARGEIVDQAVGYGDDHYIPFNLKKLKQLKGGEYIRTRSVGGPTTEDIYVGLMSGAKQMTVVSRSGTFTVKFEEDFKGKRRYNDKARRMTRRYAQILDAVQSEKVDRATVPGYVRQQITEKVQRQFPGESRTVHRQIIKDRINEYKEDPDLTPEDQAFISRMVEARFTDDSESRDAKAFRRQTTNDIMRRKGYRYKLDGAGYASGLEALREQFPYYITVEHHIKDTEDIQNLERDKGYVEPGRNRPTEAQAGLYGTKVNEGQKFSASHADFQSYRATQRGGTPNGAGEEGKETETAKTPEKPGSKVENAVAQVVQRRKHDAASVTLYEELNKEGVLTASAKDNFGILKRTPEDFASYVSTPQGGQEMEKLVAAVEGKSSEFPPPVQEALRAWRGSAGDAGFADYNDALAFKWSKVPYKFTEAPYLAGATEESRQQEVRNINQRTKSLAYGGNLSSLNEVQMKAEVEALSSAYEIIQNNPEFQAQDEAGAKSREILRSSLLGNYDQQAVGMLLSNPEMIKSRLADVHRMRTLMALGGYSPEARQQVTGRVPELETPEFKLNAISSRVQHIRDAQGGKVFSDPDAEDGILMGQDMMDRIDNGESVSNVELDTFMAETEKHLPVDELALQPHHRVLYKNSPHLFDLRVANGKRVPELRKETR